MRLSVPVTDHGSFIAIAAQSEEETWFLIAIDSRLEELSHAHFGSAREIEAAARALLRHETRKPPSTRRS